MKSIKKIAIILLRIIGIPATEENLKFSNMFYFLQSKVRKLQMSKSFINIIGKLNLDDYLALPLYKQEQIVFRMNLLQTHPQGKQCLAKNECPCECTTSDVIISDGACDKYCFGDMLGEAEWNDFKHANNFSVINNKIIKYVK